ncbi:uncharacterized protein APUU_21896S [Aspergillus puulaauensis]|uniref:DUF7730 domain-containing protein n=1 Tax=Aspergillus puulaauensis TaxID=1220207 RepID=A0A7R7XIX7_9EURO|nr:uncharacterized protein APUU_21896S [Aspergillus puulaauensis]BCS21464.1 hypothetical protein APUU_21896S [Aspergillus puulaauensis]
MAKRKRIFTPKRRTKAKLSKGSKLPLEPVEPLSQELSPLFRLPPELRHMIYEETFIAPTTIHLSWVDASNCRFRSFLCKLPVEHQYEKTRSGLLCKRCDKSHFECHPRQKRSTDNAVVRRSYRRQKHTRVMSMLQSCKRMYHETIDMLYEKNTFYIENPKTLTELCKYMPQERLSSFRTLSLESISYLGNILDPRPSLLLQWDHAIEVLRKLDGLKSLCIVMRPWYGIRMEEDTLESPIRYATAVGNLPVAPVLLWAPCLDVSLKRKKGITACPLHGIHGTESRYSPKDALLGFV